MICYYLFSNLYKNISDIHEINDWFQNFNEI